MGSENEDRHKDRDYDKDTAKELKIKPVKNDVTVAKRLVTSPQGLGPHEQYRESAYTWHKRATRACMQHARTRNTHTQLGVHPPLSHTHPPREFVLSLCLRRHDVGHPTRNHGEPWWARSGKFRQFPWSCSVCVAMDVCAALRHRSDKRKTKEVAEERLDDMPWHQMTQMAEADLGQKALAMCRELPASKIQQHTRYRCTSAPSS